MTSRSRCNWVAASARHNLCMDAEAIRRFCLTLPHTTEEVQWGDHLLFKIGGKMYATTSLGAEGALASFKATPESFAELVEEPDFRPAPYLARAHWVAMERENSVARTRIQQLLTQAHAAVMASLPKRKQTELRSGTAVSKTTKPSAAKKSATTKRKTKPLR